MEFFRQPPAQMYENVRYVLYTTDNMTRKDRKQACLT